MSGPAMTEMIMNSDGLVVNAFHNAPGRGDYFSGSSGTSEGQFLFILGLLDNYNATGNKKALKLAEQAMSSVLPTLYRNSPIPATVTKQAIFAPHWLFAVKYPFNSSTIRYYETFTFTNGVAVIPRADVRYVWNARSLDSTLLWENPYSSLTAGTMYAVASNTYVPGVGQRVTLTTPYNGSLIVTHSTQDGPVIEVNEPFEAWPDWRKLDPTEIDAACDVFVWAHRAFTRAYEVTGNPTWNDAARATRQQAAIAMDINDGRDWIKPTWTDSPFADGARFSYVDRAPAPSFAVDHYGNVVVTIPQKLTGTGEVQYGNASVQDVYANGDVTTIEVGSNRAVTVQFYIDLYQAYSDANRYFVDLPLAGVGLQSFTINLASLKNSVGATMPAGSPVYTAGLSSRDSKAHTVFIQRVRQSPPRNIAYYPGAIPFTANFLGNPPMLIDWRGPIYAGYQAPQMWMTNGNAPAAQTCAQMLADMQSQWVAQAGGPRGPFIPVFYFNRSDAVQYGPPNTFGFNGPDPNTRWGGYQYRPLAELGHVVLENAPGSAYYNIALQAADDFLGWLATDAHWLPSTPAWVDNFSLLLRKSATLEYTAYGQGAADWTAPMPQMGPPTDFPQTGFEVNYPEPHMTALILRTLLYLDTKKRPSGDANGPLSVDYQALLSKCIAVYDGMWVESGPMRGTFSNNPANHEWYGFWQGEIMTTLSILYNWAVKPSINRPDLSARCVKWLAGMTSWTDRNTQRAVSQWGTSLWPFHNDWAGGMTEAWSFSTNIITSFDGSEQRISRRPEPRRRVTLNHTLHKQKDSADYQAIVRARQNRPTLVPQWHLKCPLAVPASAGMMTVVLASEPDPSLETGGAVILTSGRDQQLTFIEEIVGNAITLEDPLIFSMLGGSALTPAFNGLLDNSLSSTKQTSTVTQTQAGFQILPQEDNRELPDRDDFIWREFMLAMVDQWNVYMQRACLLTVELPLTWPVPGPFSLPIQTFTVNGDEREVITWPANWVTTPSIEDTWTYDLLSYEAGPVTPMEGENIGRRSIQAQWSFFNKDALTEFLSLVKRLRGMQTACWLPSWTSDLVMTRDMTSETVLYVRTNSIIDEHVLDDAAVGISIQLTNELGLVNARAASYSVNGSETAITLDRPLWVPILRTDVLKISLLYRVRQATDTAEITYQTTDISECTVAFMTVQE